MDSIIGHTTVRSQLASLFKGGRFPHALLLHGPSGIGKRLVATHAAYRLICGPAQADAADMFGPAEPDPFAYNAQAPQAFQLAAGSCPDFHILEREDDKKSIGIKQVQDLLEVLRRSADTARVTIVDALEELTPEAANALLKSLEEPRPGIYFLLVCHQLGKVLPTIRSRCRMVRLTPLSADETKQVIAAHKGDASLAAIAHGRPGSVLGAEAEARQKLADKLTAWSRGEGPQPAPNTGGLLDALLAHLANQPQTLATAQAYTGIHQLTIKQKTYNLPATTVAEQALRLFTAA